MIKNKVLFMMTIFCSFSVLLSAANIFTPIADILKNPSKYENEFVTVKGLYFGWKHAPGKPPVTRSDWVIGDKFDNAIYCTGLLPEHLDPFAKKSFGSPITVLAKVKISENNKPYLEVSEVNELKFHIEHMVSVSQILFSPLAMRGKYVGLLGVLVKGCGIKGNRMYLLADPTGAIKLNKLPKLYPTGTILHIKGYVGCDENGLPVINNVEIVSAKVDLEGFKIPEKYLKKIR